MYYIVLFFSQKIMIFFFFFFSSTNLSFDQIRAWKSPWQIQWSRSRRFNPDFNLRNSRRWAVTSINMETGTICIRWCGWGSGYPKSGCTKLFEIAITQTSRSWWCVGMFSFQHQFKCSSHHLHQHKHGL